MRQHRMDCRELNRYCQCLVCWLKKNEEQEKKPKLKKKIVKKFVAYDTL